jgi:hypothetical protein
MAIKYSLNWMGPVSMNWYEQRGLTVRKVIIQDVDNPNVGYKAGDQYEIDVITVPYSTGRIDVGGTGDPYGPEIGVPPMLTEDWNRFSTWLDTFETDDVWTLDQLVELYERTNPPITWDTYSG